MNYEQIEQLANRRYENYPLDIEKKAFIQGAAFVLEHIPKWISVEELPEASKWVLLYNGHWRGVGRYRPDEEKEFCRWEDENSNWIEPAPTHWQPLPPIPSDSKK